MLVLYLNYRMATGFDLFGLHQAICKGVGTSISTTLAVSQARVQVVSGAGQLSPLPSICCVWQKT
jgi:hypothetical protein